MRPRKSNNGTLRNDTHDLPMSYPLLAMHRMEYCFRSVWKAALASLVLIHSYPRPHVLVASIQGDIGVCRGPPDSLTPRVGDDKTYITTMRMQQTSVHGRTTSRHKTGWEDRTWGYPSLSSGFST